MDIRQIRSNTRAVRAGVAALAVALLIAAGARRGHAAATPASSPGVTQTLPVQNHTAAEGRDSYADVVNVVAPAVVTVRTEGTVRISSRVPDDDLLRRFFGDQFGSTPSQPPSFKQRGLGSGVIAAALGLKQVAGAIVSSVEHGSAADRAGVKRGDVITSFDGHTVSDANALRNRVADTSPGSQVPLVVARDGSERHLTVRLDEVTAQAARGAAKPDNGNGKTTFGVNVTPLTPELASQVGVPSSVHGLLVEDVSSDSPAADAGVQAGDVIQEVNRQPVLTVDELRAAVNRPAHRPMLLLVNRAGHELFLTARVS